jgi:hypothetical protein
MEDIMLRMSYSNALHDLRSSEILCRNFARANEGAFAELACTRVLAIGWSVSKNNFSDDACKYEREDFEDHERHPERRREDYVGIP